MSVRSLILSLLAVLWLWPITASGQSPELMDAFKRAGVLYALGRYQEALPFAEKALRLGERKFGPDHPQVTRGLDDLVHRNLYTDHQRVAKRFRKGRVLLAGDSAHINNSIGGMGLNGDIQDAVNLCEKLARVWHGEAAESELDLYDLRRRTYAVDFVQEQSIQNKKRLEAKEPEKRRQNLDELRAIAADPARAKQFMLRASMIDAMRSAAKLTLPDPGARQHG